MIALNPSLIFCLLSCIHEAKSGWRVNWPLAVWAMYCVAHPNDFTCQWRKLKTWWEGKIPSFWKVKTWWEREIPNWEGKDSREGKGPKQKGKILNPSMSFLFTHETAQNLWPFSYHASYFNLAAACKSLQSAANCGESKHQHCLDSNRSHTISSTKSFLHRQSLSRMRKSG